MCLNYNYARPCVVVFVFSFVVAIVLVDTIFFFLELLNYYKPPVLFIFPPFNNFCKFCFRRKWNTWSAGHYRINMLVTSSSYFRGPCLLHIKIQPILFIYLFGFQKEMTHFNCFNVSGSRNENKNISV